MTLYSADLNSTHENIFRYNINQAFNRQFSFFLSSFLRLLTRLSIYKNYFAFRKQTAEFLHAHRANRNFNF